MGSGSVIREFPSRHFGGFAVRYSSLRFMMLVLAFAPVGCDRAPTESKSIVGSKSGETKTRGIPDEYRVLATHLGHSLKPDARDFRNDQTFAQVLAEAHAALIDLRGIRSDNAEINYLSAQGASAISEMVTRLERVDSLPKPQDPSSLFFESFLHGLAGNVTAGYELGAEADNRQKSIRNELNLLGAAVEKLDATHLLLERLAQKYAGPVDSRKALILTDFDGAWNAWPYDWCKMKNVGPDLEDCTVIIELRGKTGQTRKNIHFAPRWPANSMLVARYDPGFSLGDRVVGKTNVADVSSVVMRVLSPGASYEGLLTYGGTERRADIERQVSVVKSNLIVKVRNSLWGARYGQVIILENKLNYAVKEVQARVTAANGTSVGEFRQASLGAGETMEVGSSQISRNLQRGDKVSFWLGEAFLHSWTIP
jgi:hypothetical protein